MKVLVTGGCGLVGYHAATYYKSLGHEVDVMDNLERSMLLGHREVTFARADFNKNRLKEYGIDAYPFDVSHANSWDQFDGHDVVIHMAGQCGVPTSIKNPRRDFEVNTIGTFNGLEYARRHGSKFVLASTNKIYPIHDDPKHPTWIKRDGENRWRFLDLRYNNGIKEDANFNGARTPYGNSKYMADLLCQEYAHTYGVRTGVFRMSCIYGPNQFGFEEQGWATWFIIATMKKLPIVIYGDGEQVRDMLYVEDAVRAYDAFVCSDVDHGIWNLGGGIENTLTLHEHLDYLEKITGLRSPVTYQDWRPLDQKCYISDITKVKSDLKWNPLLSPKEGLYDTAEWVHGNLDIF